MIKFKVGDIVEVNMDLAEGFRQGQYIGKIITIHKKLNIYQVKFSNSNIGWTKRNNSTCSYWNCSCDMIKLISTKPKKPYPFVTWCKKYYK